MEALLQPFFPPPRRMQIENSNVLVTGGANGLGFAYAKELLRNGAAHVSILDLGNSNGMEAASQLNREFGEGKAIFVICDVSKPQELEAGFFETMKKFGGLDIVINNAGIMDDSRWEIMVQINYNAVVRGTLLGMQHMGKDKGGKGGIIVNIASIVGIVPTDLFPIYCGTKFAVVGLSRSFAQPYHYEKTGVRILTMCPGITNTQLITKSAERTLDVVEPEAVWLATAMQPIDIVAQGMVHIIRVGENGSVWLVDEGNPAVELEVPDLPVKKVPVN